MNPPGLQSPVRVWDLPVRLVHWSFVILIPVLWLSAENGKLDLHRTVGLVILGLVVFRVLWGFFGSSTARFSGFVRGPAAIRDYLAGVRNGTGAPVVGHNPLGALSVLALLGALALQLGLGLIAKDEDGLYPGPLSHLVSYDLSDTAAELHEVFFNAIVALVVLHVAAILYYRFVKRENLVAPMITGRRAFASGVAAPRIAAGWKALLCALVAVVIALWVSWGAPPWGARFPWDPAATTLPSPDSYM